MDLVDMIIIGILLHISLKIKRRIWDQDQPIIADPVEDDSFEADIIFDEEDIFHEDDSLDEDDSFDLEELFDEEDIYQICISSTICLIIIIFMVWYMSFRHVSKRSTLYLIY